MTNRVQLSEARVREAFFAAARRLDRYADLTARHKLLMCETLGCDPHELEALLDALEPEEIVARIMCEPLASATQKPGFERGAY